MRHFGQNQGGSCKVYKGTRCTYIYFFFPYIQDIEMLKNFWHNKESDLLVLQ